VDGVASLPDVFRVLNDMKSEGIIADLFHAKAEWHRRQARLPLKEKVRILLELQRQDHPLLKRHRHLEWWEEPWPVEP
jgi:hypothetical protein